MPEKRWMTRRLDPEPVRDFKFDYRRRASTIIWSFLAIQGVKCPNLGKILATVEAAFQLLSAAWRALAPTLAQSDGKFNSRSTP
jgi:hypothetical protein